MAESSPLNAFREAMIDRIGGKHTAEDLVDAAVGALVDVADYMADGHMLMPEASLLALRDGERMVSVQMLAADLSWLISDAREYRDDRALTLRATPEGER